MSIMRSNLDKGAFSSDMRHLLTSHYNIITLTAVGTSVLLARIVSCLINSTSTHCISVYGGSDDTRGEYNNASALGRSLY